MKLKPDFSYKPVRILHFHKTFVLIQVLVEFMILKLSKTEEVAYFKPMMICSKENSCFKDFHKLPPTVKGFFFSKRLLI